MNAIKRLVFGILFILTACSGTGYAGPSVYAGPVTLSAHRDGTGRVVLDSSFSYVLGTKDLGVGWDVGYETTLNEAKTKKYTLYILYEDNEGNVIQDAYDITQPFEVSFSNEQWVDKIAHEGDGNIIVSVKPMSAAQVQSSSPMQPLSNTTSSNVNTSSDPETFVRNYFYTITHDRNYQYTWSLMTDSFKAKNSPGGYASYVKTWDAIESVEVNSISFYEKSNTSAKCSVSLTFHATGGLDNENVKYHLIYDSSQQTWMFESP